jgi:hypothetical protein
MFKKVPTSLAGVGKKLKWRMSGSFSSNDFTSVASTVCWTPIQADAAKHAALHNEQNLLLHMSCRREE